MITPDLLDMSLGKDLYNIRICDLSMRIMATGTRNVLESFAERLMQRMEALGIPCMSFSGENAIKSFIVAIKALSGIQFTGLILYLPKRIHRNELIELSCALASSRRKGACVCLFRESPFTDYLSWRKVLDKCNSFICLSADVEDDGFRSLCNAKKRLDGSIVKNLLSERIDMI